MDYGSLNKFSSTNSELKISYSELHNIFNSGTKASPKYFHIGDRKENIVQSDEERC